MKKIIVVMFSITLGLFCCISFAQTERNVSLICRMNPQTKKIELLKKVVPVDVKIKHKTMLQWCKTYYQSNSKPAGEFRVRVVEKRNNNGVSCWHCCHRCLTKE
ncbi:MAG: hypothetical protein KAS93_00990 [Gammaproteobacteria bacterium]|nr:hypothetical protein [Gammaproteobacteria bacterium]